MIINLSFPFARYAIYTIPFLVVLTAIGDHAIQIGDEAKPFIFLIIITTMLIPFSTDEGLKDIFFIFAGISISFLKDIPQIKLRSMALLLFLGTIIYFSIYGNFRSGLLFNIATSSSSFEGSFSFMFGMIAPFALLEKRLKLTLFCLVMTVLTLKRIAILASIISCLLVFLGERRTLRILNPLLMIVANCTILFLVLMYAFGSFDSIISFITGQSANQFGMGRKMLYSLPAATIFSEPYMFIFFGKGAGSVYELANRGIGLYSTTSRLHSDVLKIFYEYGLIVFCTFIGLMYSSKKFSTKVGFFYMNVLFLTDNTLIYAFVLILFVYCVKHASAFSKEMENTFHQGQLSCA